MKHKISIFVSAFVLVSCGSNPHKAEVIKTDMTHADVVSGTQSVGVKDGEMVVLNKSQMSERLRDLQNGVYVLEDRVYGTRKLGSLGLYGELKACKRKLSSAQFGGTGNMTWSEPLDRVTDKEEEAKAGLDEKKELVAVSEEYLKDRIQRFQNYRIILQKRADDFTERIEACKAEVATKEMDSNQPNRVLVSELPKNSIERAEINKYMCDFVKPEASLQAFMLNAFARGWLALSDFRMDQNLIPVSLKDAKGVAKNNALIFNGWKLAFDRDRVTVGELLGNGKDARLVAWAFEHKTDVPKSEDCLKAADGQWNP